VAYTFDPIFAADPSNPANVAPNAAILIYDPNDAGKAPVTITDLTGSPLPNPVTVNKNGFGSAFQHATLDRLAWSGAGFEGFFTSYEGMKEEAVAARAAAEAAGATAAVAAAEGVAPVVAEAEAAADAAAAAQAAAASSATAAANSAALVGAPADTAMAAAANNAGSQFRTALADTIATEAVPKTADAGYDIWILAGQSNMEGRGLPYDTTRLDPIDPRIFQYSSSGTWANQINAAVDPLDMYGTVKQGIGPGMQFARWQAGVIPANRRILLVPVAAGGTAFAPNISGETHTWNVAAPDDANSLYNFMLRQAKAAKAAAGPGARFAGVLWLQGESDALSSTPRATYEAHLDALIDGTRAALGVADLPFVIGQMIPESRLYGQYFLGIDTAHVETPYRKTRTAFAYGELNSHSDGTHYTGPGQRKMGRSMFSALPIALANVLGTPPLSPTAVTLTQSGTSIVVGWERPACRATDYLIEHRPAGGAWATLSRARSIDALATITGRSAGVTYEVRVSTINEQGTSVASTPATIAMIAPPAQVTGLAAGTPTGTSVPLTWSATSGATAYKVEYKKTSDSTWTTFSTTVTTASTTVTGLGSELGYDFRVSAINAGGTGTASATVSATTAALPAFLDSIPSAWRAYSVARKLSNTYSGSAIRVRRSSDSTETDIGFVSGALDTASLLTFAGSGDAFVVTMYDQSGNARHMTAAAASQPKIVTAGVLEAINSKPAMKFDGSNDVFTDTTIGLHAAGASTITSVIKMPSMSAANLVSEHAATGGMVYKPIGTSATQIHMQVTNDALSSSIATGGASVFNDAAHVLSTVDTGTALKAWSDAASLVNTAYTRSGTLTLTRFSIGAAGQDTISRPVTGLMSEMVVWSSALSDANRVTAQSNEKNYYGTP